MTGLVLDRIGQNPDPSTSEVAMMQCALHGRAIRTQNPLFSMLGFYEIALNLCFALNPVVELFSVCAVSDMVQNPPGFPNCEEQLACFSSPRQVLCHVGLL